MEIVGTIANASVQQANSISEINQGIEQISQITQTNTATAEESASASEEMASQAQMLKGLIEAFKLRHIEKEIAGYSGSLEHEESPMLTDDTQNTEREAPSEVTDMKDVEIAISDDFGKY